MMKKIVFLFCGISLNMVNAQLSKGEQTYSVGGRDYAVTTPTNYDSTKEYPVVFELHSFGRDKNQMNDQTIVNQQQYISVRPEGTSVFLVGRVWNTWSETNTITGRKNDVAYITEVYEDVKRRMGNAFNTNKVYVYGFSNGGAMAMKMVEETSLFKAAIIRSMSFTDRHSIPNTAAKIPMIFVHGIQDETIPYQGGTGKYGILSPKFESIKTTVEKWANYNNLSQPLEIKYLKGGSSTSVNDFYFREYSHSTYPIYFFAIDGGVHATVGQFSNANIKRALIRLVQNPSAYGIYRDVRN